MRYNSTDAADCKYINNNEKRKRRCGKISIGLMRPIGLIAALVGVVRTCRDIPTRQLAFPPFRIILYANKKYGVEI